MKALKSRLASELLAEPKARDRLRQFLVTKRPSEIAACQAGSGRLKFVAVAGAR